MQFLTSPTILDPIRVATSRLQPIQSSAQVVTMRFMLFPLLGRVGLGDQTGKQRIARLQQRGAIITG